MNYQEALSYVHSLLRFGINPGLERIEALLNLMDNPHKELRFVHVAGTNGKGSVCSMCANVLHRAGYKTGLFTSPFVIDFCERIKVDGKMIEQDEIAQLLTSVKPLVKELAKKNLQPTEFEVITAVAMKYFAIKKCDVVVLETGLGGRFDSTNIISTPLLSIITCISLDHTDVLGDTISKIAFEKCGIIKEGGTTVCYPYQHPSAFEVIEKTAQEMGNKLVLGCIDEITVKESSISGTVISWNGAYIDLKLIGEYQVLNASTAISALEELRAQGFDISHENIKDGIEDTVMPGRFEIVSQDPVVILDGAHNADGVDSFISCVEKLLPDKKKIFIMGTMSDKDYEFTIERVARAADEFIATTPSNSRSLFACLACEIASEFCERTAAISSPKDALTYALFQARTYGHALIICGSLYLAGEIRELIVKRLPSQQE